ERDLVLVAFDVPRDASRELAAVGGMGESRVRTELVEAPVDRRNPYAKVHFTGEAGASAREPGGAGPRRGGVAAVVPTGDRRGCRELHVPRNGQVDEGVTAEELVVIDDRRHAGAARDAAAGDRGRAGGVRLVLHARADRGARLAIQVHLVEGVARLVTEEVQADVRADHRLAAWVDWRVGRGCGGRMESLPDAGAEVDEVAGNEATDLDSVHAEPAVQVLEDDVDRRLDLHLS